MTAKSASDQKTAENRILQNFSYKPQKVSQIKHLLPSA
jgi:hypothetical protein